MRSVYSSTTSRSAGCTTGHWFGPRSRRYGGHASAAAGAPSGAISTCSRRSGRPAVFSTPLD
eukprot:1216376-Prymnesium_polylepis.1